MFMKEQMSPPIKPVPLKTGRSFTRIVLLVVVIIFVASGYLFYKTQQKIAQNNAQTGRAIQQLSAQVQAHVRDNEDVTLALESADALVRQAQLQLMTGNTIIVAIQFLKLADQKIAGVDQPSLQDIRQALANNISQLQALRLVDVTHLIIQLDAFNHQVTALTMAPQTAPPAPPTIPTASFSNDWKGHFQKTVNKLKEFIVIRHYTQPIEPLLNDEQLNFLKQNIQLKVYQAEWAVLQQQSDLYQHNLTLIRSWIQTYYTQNPALANSLLEELDNLLKITLTPTLPDLNPVLALIHANLNNGIPSISTPMAPSSVPVEKNIPTTSSTGLKPENTPQKPLLKELPKTQTSVEA